MLTIPHSRPTASLSRLRLDLRPLLLLLTASLAALLLLACGDSDDPPAAIEVHVGLIQSLTGSGASYAESSHRGMMLALEEIAHDPDFNLTITTTLHDDESSIEVSTRAMEALIEGGVDAIIGPTLSGVAFAIHPLAQAAGIVVLSPTTTASGITEAGDHIFSLALTEARVVPEVIAYAAAEHQVSRAVMFWDSEEAFSPFSSAAMRTGIEQVDGTMVAEFDLSAESLEDAVATLNALDFDLILVSPLLDIAVEVLEALRAAGHDQLVIGGNSFNTPQISAEAGAAVEGTYVGSAWNPQVASDASRAFVEAYEAEYGVTPDLFAAQGYTSMYVLADAVRRAGSADPAAIRDALRDTRDLETPLGAFSFDEQRGGVHQPVIQRFEQGVLQVVAP